MITNVMHAYCRESGKYREVESKIRTPIIPPPEGKHCSHYVISMLFNDKDPCQEYWP